MPLALLLLSAHLQLLPVPLLLLPAPLQLLLVPMLLLPVSMMLPLVPLLLLNVPLLPLRPSTAATPPPCTRRPDCMLLLLHEPLRGFPPGHPFDKGGRPPVPPARAQRWQPPQPPRLLRRPDALRGSRRSSTSLALLPLRLSSAGE